MLVLLVVAEVVAVLLLLVVTICGAVAGGFSLSRSTSIACDILMDDIGAVSTSMPS